MRLDTVISLSRRKQGFESPRERHRGYQAIDFCESLGGVCHFVQFWFATLVRRLSLNRLPRQPFLICRARVAFDLGQSFVSGDRGDLACGTSCFGEAPRCSFSKAMRFAARWQTGFADRCRNHVAETLHGEGLAVGGHKYCGIASIRHRKHTLKVIMNWNDELCRGLALGDANGVRRNICP